LRKEKRKDVFGAPRKGTMSKGIESCVFLENGNFFRERQAQKKKKGGWEKLELDFTKWE